ncbi:class I SAM-dependent RNA methyltransferase [Rickettsiales endosymbiont of Stachyamoeba lipophora]|uniref:class I SAM-dependent RNA methyltransferase n=1 Tax=Rickettsiales endosymbiont of Stachyamoeba lipophora TaxID=2486578 RepID=UPI0013DDDAE0|nr:TRAM domain-containing protein [Rickettsiales endosymbiont of Stachyamoeba lipophora]
MKEQFTVLIERQGFKGDGIGSYRNKKVMVPFAVVGDVLEVELIKENSKLIEAKIVDTITPSSHRVIPVCKYFTSCGGCDMQHLSDNLYQETKLKQVKESIMRAGFSCGEVNFVAIKAKSRRKTRLHVKDGKIGFYHKNSHHIVPIESCEVLPDEVMGIIKTLRERELSSRRDVDIVLTNDGYIEIGNYLVKYDNYFLQSSAETNNIVASLIQPTLTRTMKILDLFAGVGAYSLLLHGQVAAIYAVEGDEKVQPCLNETLSKYAISNIQFTLQDLYKQPITPKALNQYDTIIINPPKNGAEPQFREIAKSNVASVHVISCNPITLERDLKYLSNAGFKIKQAHLIDQFKWSYHSEVYLHLAR